jgi:DNA-binding response OmpR family regulator
MTRGRTRRSGGAQSPGPVVLIVDDNPDILLLLETNLRRTGFRVAKAADGELALRAIEEDPPDVVLLDLMMPVLDGWGVLDRLKGRPGAPPVIIISAATSQSNVDRAYELGAVGYITKPFSLTEMIDKINEVLSGDPSPQVPVQDRRPRRPVG